MNAVFFQLNNAASIYKYDSREDTYCRFAVSTKQIHLATAKKLPKGQFWIYITPNQQTNTPSKKFPIVQSYVDIFLSGCFELQDKFHLKNFARDCIRTTYFWSRGLGER